MAESSLENGQVVAARYTLLRRLGAGRDTQVWLVTDASSGRERALKLLCSAREIADPVRRAFIEAAHLQSRIEHPNVLRCDGVDETTPYAVFEYCSHGDLARLRGRPWRELVPLLGGVAAGVGALHAAGIVHRDLKAANVLLGDDGTPKLADLGLAAPIGSVAESPAGSPFSASPQQLDGAPAAVADDAYGFGALCYELLTGYPPYYPDAAAARERSGPPPALAVSDLPAAFRELVTSCLDVDPARRPQDFTAIRATLRSIAAEAGSSSTRAAGVTLKPPRDVVAGIEPSWQRTPPVKGPDSAQLRAQGFRRGLVAAAIAVLVIAAGLAFAVLPRLVQEPVATAPPPVKPAETPATPPPEKDFAKLGALKAKFDELRPRVLERLQRLEQRSAADWAGEPFARGREGFAAAEALAADRDYEAALPRLEAASADLTVAEKSAADKLRAALAAGREALERGTAEEAQRQFTLALKIDPANAVAKRGLERAATLDEVRRLLADASLAEQSGDRATAEQAWRAALELDRDAQPAHEGLARLQSAASEGAYAAAVAAGLDALSRRDAAAARAAFDRAGKIRPGAPEVQDGLAQVERLLGDTTIEQSLAAAQAAEREERWSDALGAYRKALAIDPNLLAAQQGLERSEPRAMLDAELRAYIDKPERLFTTDVRAAARNALQRARSIAAPGPVLSRQVSTIDQLIGSAETPVALAISSDNVTEVTIYRVGKLGVFERRDMTLLPGRYTVVGTRAGYRDVRRELTILPGQPSAAVAIRCEEPI